jgi:hypothetical protein
MAGFESAIARARGAILTLGTAYAAFEFGKGVVTAGMQMQSLSNRMIAATGDAKVAGAALAYVRDESNRLGLDFRTTAESFGNFSASALRSGMTLKETRSVFSGHR